MHIEIIEKRGVYVVAMFDVARDVVGKKVGDVRVFDMSELEQKLDEYRVDIVILTLPKDKVEDVVSRLGNTGIHGVWNFTGNEIKFDGDSIVVENVHMGDSLMTLCYEIAKITNEINSKE